MMDRTLLAVILGVLISLFGVLGQNLTNDDTNEVLLKNLARGNEWTPQSPGAKSGSLGIVGGPMLHHTDAAVKRSQGRIQLSNILESKKLLRDMGLSTKSTNAMETSARATERTQNSTESLGFPEINTHDKESSEDLTEDNRITERVTKVTGSSSSKNKAKYPGYDLYDVTPFNEKPRQEVQLYKMLVGLVVQHINAVNVDKTQRIQKAVPNKNHHRTDLLSNDNTIQISSKAVKDNVNPNETFGGKSNSSTTTEVNKSSDRMKDVTGSLSIATESRRASAIAPNYSVPDVTHVIERVQKDVQFYKKLLSMVLYFSTLMLLVLIIYQVSKSLPETPQKKLTNVLSIL